LKSFENGFEIKEKQNQKRKFPSLAFGPLGLSLSPLPIA